MPTPKDKPVVEPQVPAVEQMPAAEPEAAPEQPAEVVESDLGQVEADNYARLSAEPAKPNSEE